MPCSRFCTFLALLCAVLLPSSPVGARSATDPAVIKALAAEAYVWGLGPEFIERFSKYSTIIGAPFNGSCTRSLRLIPQPDKPGKMLSLQHVYEGGLPGSRICFSTSSR